MVIKWKQGLKHHFHPRPPVPAQHQHKDPWSSKSCPWQTGCLTHQGFTLLFFVLHRHRVPFSLHYSTEQNQSKTLPCPEASLDLCRERGATSGFRGCLPPKATSSKEQKCTSKGNVTKVITDGLHTFSLKHTQQFLFSQKKREKGTVTGVCIQNHIWIQGKLLGKKLTIESGAGALSKENERKERTIFCSYNGSTVLFVIISYREACTYKQFILESGLKHTNIYTQASSPAMVGNCHLQNWDQYWLCTLKSQKVIQAIEAMG